MFCSSPCFATKAIQETRSSQVLLLIFQGCHRQYHFSPEFAIASRFTIKSQITENVLRLHDSAIWPTCWCQPPGTRTAWCSEAPTSFPEKGWVLTKADPRSWAAPLPCKSGRATNQYGKRYANGHYAITPLILFPSSCHSGWGISHAQLKGPSFDPICHEHHPWVNLMTIVWTPWSTKFSNIYIYIYIFASYPICYVYFLNYVYINA